MSKKANPQDDKLRPHVYDGIQEYDNRLPNWWLWTFYLAIIFSAVYWFSWYNADIMKTDAQVVEKQMSLVEEARLAAIGEIDNTALWQMSRNEGFVSSGEVVYKEKCIACHGPDLRAGAGLAGVNLVDNEWKWGNEPISVYAIVTRGSPDKTAGMQSWVSELGPQKIAQVVAFILSHHNEQEMAEAGSLNPPMQL